MGAAFGIGFIVGPLIGGTLGLIGTRVPFYAAGALTLANWLYGWFILPESLQPGNRRSIDWSRANPFGAFAALRARPQVMWLAVCALFSFVAHTVYPSVWVLYTEFRYGWTPLWNGLSLAAVGVCAAVVSAWLTGKVTARVGDWRTAFIGPAVAVCGYIGYGLATNGWMVFVIILFGSIGGLAAPAVQSLISNSVGDDEQGAMQSAITSLESIAGIIGPLLATNLFSYFIAQDRSQKVPGAPFFAAALIGLMAFFLAFKARTAARAHGADRVGNPAPEP